MTNTAQKGTSTHHYVITGCVDEDRKFFSKNMQANTDFRNRHYRLDLMKVNTLDIVTLGLIVWLHETISSHGHSIEFVNAASSVQKALGVYRLV